jgi:large subunit ribosomal protein L24
MHVKRGDMVTIVTGKEKGQKGRVLRVLRDKDRVLVEGRNLVKRHMKPNPLIGREGGIVEKEASIHVSNVALYSEKLDGPVRTQKRFVGSGGELFSEKKEAAATYSDAPARIPKIRFAPKTGERFE